VLEIPQAIGSGDPLTVVAHVLISYRRLLGWVVVITLVAMLSSNDWRVAAIVTLWGVLGAGLVVSLVLEQHGEVRQRRIWLRRNASHVAPVLGNIVSFAGMVAATAVGLPNDTANAMRLGKTARERASAAKAARFAIQEYGNGRPVPGSNGRSDYGQWGRSVAEITGRIDGWMNELVAVRGRFVELDASVNRWKMVSQLSNVGFQPGTSVEEMNSSRERYRTVVANEAMDLMELVNRLLEDAGVLA
jgi:hypothetical protein